MIDEQSVERALDYLTKSAVEYAKAKGRARALAFRLKVGESEEYLKVEGGSQEYKKSVARSSDAYKELVDEYENAEIEALTIEAYREAAALKIGSWQSIVKAKSQGLI
jgi:hypothetical protein